MYFPKSGQFINNAVFLFLQDCSGVVLRGAYLSQVIQVLVNGPRLSIPCLHSPRRCTFFKFITSKPHLQCHLAFLCSRIAPAAHHPQPHAWQGESAMVSPTTIAIKQSLEYLFMYLFIWHISVV